MRILFCRASVVWKDREFIAGCSYTLEAETASALRRTHPTAFLERGILRRPGMPARQHKMIDTRVVRHG